MEGTKLAGIILSLLGDEARLQEMGRLNESFLRQDAVAEIVRYVDARLEGKTLKVDGSVPAHASPELPGNSALLAQLERSYGELGKSYTPNAVIAHPDDLAYLQNRAASLLIRSDWEERNLGVKLLGLLKAKEKIPLLLAVFHDRRQASLVKRLFGGDFEQVGFIRRNIITALVRLDEINAEIEAALLVAFRDPYYEVRAEAARAAAHFGCRISSLPEIVSALLRLVRDRKIEVAVAAVQALGNLGDERVALPALLALKQFKFWKVRAAALKGILALVERGVVTDFQALSKDLPEFILTSTDFTPQFEIKSEYRQLMEAISKGRGTPQ